MLLKPLLPVFVLS